MKSFIRTFIVLALSFPVVMSSCRKDEDIDDTPVVTTSFSAKIDGVQFTTGNAMGMLTIDDNEIYISGDNSDGWLSLFLTGDIVPGTYTLEAGSSETIDWEPEGGFSYYLRPGTLNVTKHDVSTNRIEGNFNGTLVSTMPPNLQLTDGIFKITYTEL